MRDDADVSVSIQLAFRPLEVCGKRAGRNSGEGSIVSLQSKTCIIDQFNFPTSKKNLDKHNEKCQNRWP